ncbi:MAG: DUF5659 domain-containing protein [Candidatus Omnitrophota bacterium]
MNLPKIFETADLYLSAYLRSYDLLPKNKKTENNKTFWIYSDSETLRNKVFDYQHDEWVRKFIKAIRDQKYQIFNPSELIF